MNNPFRPYFSDIRQIESLTKLGCNHDDIAMVLGVTPARLQKWEERNTAIAGLLKPKARPEYTVHHPEFAPIVEEAFTCAGKRFYRFVDEYRMPAGRYKYYYAFLREIEMHMSLDKLKKYVEAFKGILNGANSKRGIQLGDLWKLVWNLDTVIALDFDPQTVRNLACAAYFDESEDLTTFDQKCISEKLKLWEENNVHDFFLTKPISELLGLNNLSIESLADSLTEREAILRELDSDLQTVLKDNS